MFQMSDVQSDYSDVENSYVEYSDDEGVIPVDHENEEEDEEEEASRELNTVSESDLNGFEEEDSEVVNDRPSWFPRDIKIREEKEEEEEDKHETVNSN